MSASPALVILLHGVGSKGADMAGLIPLLAAALPGVAFAAPDGPEPFNGGGNGRQWFSVAGISDESRPTRVAKGREAFDATLCAIIAEHGLRADPGRVALVGFSQGAIMALDAVATARWPLAGVVAFSGRLAGPAPLGPDSQGSAALHHRGSEDPDGHGTMAQLLSPVLLIHGANDPVIAASETLQARARLAALGHQAHKVVLPDLGHAIDARGLTEASQFLKQLLCTEGPAAARPEIPAAH